MNLAKIFLGAQFAVLMLIGVANAQPPSNDLKQLVEQLQKTPDDSALRGQIIALASKAKHAPVVPDEAHRHLERGIAAFEVARSPEDFNLAIAEFQSAANVAPWWPDAYFNLAKAQEKTQDFKGAIGNYQFYLLAAPGAKDAEAVRTQSYKLEFLAERKAKDDDVKAKAAQLAQQAQGVLTAFMQQFGGQIYTGLTCYTGFITQPDGTGKSDGCTEEERAGTYWHVYPPNGLPGRFVLPGDGTVRFIMGLDDAYPTYDIQFIGTPAGPTVNDMRWECPATKLDSGEAKLTGTRPGWFRVAPAMSNITYTCATTDPNPMEKYFFVSWTIRSYVPGGDTDSKFYR